MDLERVFFPGSVELNKDISSKEDILKSISKLAVKNPQLAEKDPEEIFKALWEREKMGSTGLTEGIAIPHCAIDGIGGFVLGVLTTSKGVEFESLDGKPARVFVFLIGDTRDRNTHIKFLSAIAAGIRKGQNHQLLETGSKEEVTALINSVLRGFDKGSAAISGDRAMLHIFIQDEAGFALIMELFSGAECCYINVLETNPASSYFQELPLFASFWNPPEDTFNRLVFAVIPRALSNKILGDIDSIINGLDDRDKILVVMNDISYFNGAIGF